MLEFHNGDGVLLLYGSRHFFDPKDPQTNDIQREWTRFAPTIAYNEGGNPPAETTVERAVEHWGEPGLVRSLAAWNRVPVLTFEPTREQEVNEFLKYYTPEQVKIYLALLGYRTFRASNRNKTANDYLGDALAVLNRTKGLEGPPRDAKEFTASFAKLFPGQGRWQDVPDDWFDPTQTTRYTNEASGKSTLLRDQHIFRVLTERTRRGERVMAVIGGSHVPALRPAFVAVFGEPITERHGISEP